jgi:hypothetical protein
LVLFALIFIAGKDNRQGETALFQREFQRYQMSFQFHAGKDLHPEAKLVQPLCIAGIKFFTL